MMTRSRIAAGLALAALVSPVDAVRAQKADSSRVVAAGQAGTTMRVLVEYVGGANLYLTAGRASGLAPNDTITVRAVRGAKSGHLRVISIGETRTVVAFAGASFPVTRGDSIDITIPPGRQVAAATAVADSVPGDTVVLAATPSRGAAAVKPRPPGASRTVGTRRPPPRTARVDGSLSFDLDAMSSTSTAGGDGAGEPWRFVTPTARLHATASRLPGNARITVNASWAQYYANGSPAPGRTDHLRLYQALFEKVFTAAPVQFMAGRFLERHDIWGGYLDGAAVRLGPQGDGAGIGVSAGRTPVGAEQSLFSGGERMAVFADFRRRGAELGYEMDVAFTRRTWTDAPAERYVGLTQRLRFGSGSLYQRARVDFDPVTGAADVSQFDLMSALPLGAGWMVRGRYSRRSFDWVVGAGVTAVERRERAGGGLSWSGGRGSLSLDAQVVRWGDKPLSPVYSGSLYLPRLVGFLGFSVNGSVNRDPDVQSAYVAPGLLVQAGPVRADASWRWYRTTTRTFDATTQGTSFSISFPLRRRLQAALRGDFQNGGGSASRRLYSGFWMSF